MIPITAVIPSRFDTGLLPSLVENIYSNVADIYIMDNGLDDDLKAKLKTYKKVMLVDCPNKSIYEMWNLGMDLTVECHTSKSYTAVLNDDISVLPDTIAVLAGFLDYYTDLVAVCPDYSLRLDHGFGTLALEFCTSTFGHNGLAGFAFVIKNEYNIRIDETFKWWYGDDDLVKQIIGLDKKVGKVRGLPIEHIQGSSFNHLKENLSEQIILDRRYFNQKYGEHR